MFKAFLAGALILTSAALPATAEIGPGIGGRQVISSDNSDSYVAHICTNDSDGRVSLRIGAGRSNEEILKLSNNTNINVLNNKTSRDEDDFVWFKVRYQGKHTRQGWVRSDYVCKGSAATAEEGY